MHLIESNELVGLKHRKTGLKSTGGTKTFSWVFDIVKPFKGKEIVMQMKIKGNRRAERRKT